MSAARPPEGARAAARQGEGIPVSAGNVPFSWHRFALLARAHGAEQYRQYLAHMLVTGLLYAVLLLFALGVSRLSAFETGTQSGFYFWGLYLTGFVFAGRYFDAMARRESALLALMRPASVLEKWLLCLLVVAVAYPLAYTVLFLAISWPAQQVVLAAQALMERSSPLNPADYALFVPLLRAQKPAQLLGLPQQWGFFIGLWALQALAVAGSLYFRRAALLKTVALGFALAVLTALLCVAAGARHEVVFAWWARRAPAADPAVHAFNALLWLVLPALLWWQAYVHLREKELP